MKVSVFRILPNLTEEIISVQFQRHGNQTAYPQQCKSAEVNEDGQRWYEYRRSYEASQIFGTARGRCLSYNRIDVLLFLNAP